MFKITDTTIEVTRGDAMAIDFYIDDYTFKPDDKIEFRVYSKKGLDRKPLISKEVLIDTETEKVRIDISSTETKIGEFVNKPVTYWYEIELNDAQTIIGYDEDGAKELILYPEGYERGDE